MAKRPDNIPFAVVSGGAEDIEAKDHAANIARIVANFAGSLSVPYNYFGAEAALDLYWNNVMKINKNMNHLQPDLEEQPGKEDES